MVRVEYVEKNPLAEIEFITVVRWNFKIGTNGEHTFNSIMSMLTSLFVTLVMLTTSDFSLLQKIGPH